MTREPNRADARRNREAILAAATRELSRTSRPRMRELAAAAGVSRSTFYRHFATREQLYRGLRDQALEEARSAVDAALADDRAPLAVLRRLVDALVEIGERYPLELVAGPSLGEAANEIAGHLSPLAKRLQHATDVTPELPADWLRVALADFLERCLGLPGAGDEDPRLRAETIFRSLTDPLDRGLLVLDANGGLLALNPPAREALGLSERVERGERVTTPHMEVVHEDGSPSPSEAYPLDVALRTGVPQIGAVRGLRQHAALRWIAIDARPLRRSGFEEPYGLLGIFADVTEQKRFELAHLRPAGELGRAEPVPLDVWRALDEVPAHLFPEQLLTEAMRIVGVPVALYVLDIDGSHLLRLAGTDDFPARLEAPLALGPELAEDGIPELRARLKTELPGAVVAPMWLRGRAVGLLLSFRTSEERLLELARQGAAAMELAGAYTDVFDAARRRKDMNPAAEIQQSLLPPRIARLADGEVAGSVLPSYDVGGDWFDYVENRGGAWLAIADAAGKGPAAGGLGSVGLAALRAARRNEAGLEGAAQTMHDAICGIEWPEFFVTGIIARWHAVYSSLSWINCGHPAPLLIRSDDTVEELRGEPNLPLGLGERERRFRRRERRLEPGDRLVLYSDGISTRPTRNGLFGIDGIAQAAAGADPPTATATVRAIQEAVVAASERPLRDDAAVIVLAPGVAAAT